MIIKLIAEVDDSKDGFRFDEEKLKTMLNGPSYKLILWEVMEHIRRKTKHSEKEHHDLEEVRDLILQELNDHNVDLDVP